ncbi:TetR/AcrR family transcriptional regulator [Clostridium sp. KNHs216]|uniref:TetR/AcrR family transcriptional regulator n=1 Tax=Clostridium sp. KNHs216 TaxID=1550235 RepID=UPI00116C7581|nr:TetR/AcrR family transcriptional regulator [Clostridium sp. KNHs216]TQI68026.1 TetR family transcriptional regulator [Clostridium sp. KNHs216]
MKTTKILENKKLKMTKLYDAAYELFTSNGVHNTIIDDIVKKAGVAKGTFYLYCKDKYDLVDKIILKKSAAVFDEAMKAVAERQKIKEMDFLQSVIFFVDYLVEFFKKNKKLLSLIYKNLSWDLYEKALTYDEMEGAKRIFIQHFITAGGDSEIARQRLYIVVSMVGAVCYNSIVLEMPYPIDSVKGELYRSIREILA